MEAILYGDESKTLSDEEPASKQSTAYCSTLYSTQPKTDKVILHIMFPAYL